MLEKFRANILKSYHKAYDFSLNILQQIIPIRNSCLN